MVDLKNQMSILVVFKMISYDMNIKIGMHLLSVISTDTTVFLLIYMSGTQSPMNVVYNFYLFIYLLFSFLKNFYYTSLNLQTTRS